MKVHVAAQAGNANHFTLVIDVKREISETLCRSTQVAQVSHRACFPKQGVQRLETDQVIRVEGGACTRCAGNLAVVVDRFGNSLRVPSECGELLDLALLPDGRLKLELLRGWAVRVQRGVLREPGHNASTVDLVGRAVVAS